MTKGHVGMIVHVGLPAECIGGVIVETGRSSRVRLFRNSGVRVPGALDTEGDYRHASDPIAVDMPDGGKRDLPTWHVPKPDCEG